MFNFEKLRVYQEGVSLVDLIYSISCEFPKEELFGLSNQLRRAVVSVVLNIAEGTSRTKKDFRHFLDVARGSCYECVAILFIAKNRKYISDKQYVSTYEQLEKLSRMISKLKNSIG